VSIFEQWARGRTDNRIALHLRATKTEVHPLPARGMFNQRCHSNAVQYQSENGGDVVECIYLEDGVPVLHYVNRNEEGEYLVKSCPDPPDRVCSLSLHHESIV